MKKYILCVICFLQLSGCTAINFSDSVVSEYLQKGSPVAGLLVMSFTEEYMQDRYDLSRRFSSNPEPYRIKIQSIDNKFILKKSITRERWDKDFSQKPRDSYGSSIHGKFEILALEKGSYELFLYFDNDKDDYIYRSFTIEPGTVKYIGNFATLGSLPTSIIETPVVQRDRFEEDCRILKQKYKPLENIEILKEENELIKQAKILVSQCRVSQELISKEIGNNKKTGSDSRGVYPLKGWDFKISDIERSRQLPLALPDYNKMPQPFMLNPSHSFFTVTVELENITNENMVIINREYPFLIDSSGEAFCMKGFLMDGNINPFIETIIIKESSKKGKVQLVFDVPEESTGLKLKIFNELIKIPFSRNEV